MALLPLMGVLFLLVRWRLGRPALFRQVRVGQGERLFEMVKFRTMRDALGLDGLPLPDGQRLTPLGRWLRATSLDELPELWHVVRGEMSLVGPRPLLPSYLPLYSARQRLRHEVRPGITGWAQINGRNEASWPDRLERDVWYVEHQSFALDLKILWLTVWRVLRRDGIAAGEGVTMLPFTGNEEAPREAAGERC